MSISFQCPTCGKKLKAPDDCTGRKTKCPQCQSAVTVPNQAITQAPLLPKPKSQPRPLPSLPALPPAPALPPVYDGEIVDAEPEPQPIRRRREKDCLSCGELVADKANVCKHCGADPDEEPRRRRAPSSAHAETKTNIFINTGGGRGFPHVLHLIITLCTLRFLVPGMDYLLAAQLK